MLRAGPGPHLYKSVLGAGKDGRRATTPREGDSPGVVTEAHAVGRAGGLSTPPADAGTSRARTEDL